MISLIIMMRVNSQSAVHCDPSLVSVYVRAGEKRKSPCVCHVMKLNIIQVWAVCLSSSAGREKWSVHRSAVSFRNSSFCVSVCKSEFVFPYKSPGLGRKCLWAVMWVQMRKTWFNLYSCALEEHAYTTSIVYLTFLVTVTFQHIRGYQTFSASDPWDLKSPQKCECHSNASLLFKW